MTEAKEPTGYETIRAYAEALAPAFAKVYEATGWGWATSSAVTPTEEDIVSMIMSLYSAAVSSGSRRTEEDWENSDYKICTSCGGFEVTVFSHDFPNNWSLQWKVNGSRADAAYGLDYLSRFAKAAKKATWGNEGEH